MSFADDFSPNIIGADRIKLTLDTTTLNPAAGQAVLVNVDVSSAAADGGLVLPLEIVVQAPTVAGSSSVVQRNHVPVQIPVFPISGGSHMVMVREIGHNRFFGALTFDVAGDTIDQPPQRT